jgi:hypothetical protein
MNYSINLRTKNIYSINHSLSDNATTPGSCLPSTSSSEAPPPVLTCESFSADPFTFLRRATVSPPPATEVAPF